jgi:hypothetical protein
MGRARTEQDAVGLERCARQFEHTIALELGDVNRPSRIRKSSGT